MGSKNCVFFLFLEESHFVLFVVLPEKEVGSGEAYCMGRAACLKAKRVYQCRELPLCAGSGKFLYKKKNQQEFIFHFSGLL